MKEKVLVHICCAPDAIYFLERFKKENPDKELIGFFYDPNIHPYEEYKLRLIETKRACKKLGIPLIEGEYNVEDWLKAVKGLENEPERGERCSVCFDFRLERSAKLAKELGCTSMTTTLLMSPKKRFDQLKESGEKVSKKYGINFIAVDYRKGGGVQEMFKLTKENEFYQQDYCGCIYGLFQQKQELSVWDLVSLRGRRPGSKEETIFIKEIRLFAEDRKLPVKEFEFSFLNWKLIEGGIWIKKRPIPSYVMAFSQSIRGKVRADVERVSGNILYLNKQGVRIFLVEKLHDIPLEDITNITNPTFIVEERFKEELLNNRIDATLRTEFMPEKSRVLIVGSLDAEKLTGIPADTLQDMRGINKEFAERLIEEKEEDIREGKEALVFLGAYSLGRPSERFFEEITGRRIDEVLDVYNEVVIHTS